MAHTDDGSSEAMSAGHVSREELAAIAGEMGWPEVMMTDGRKITDEAGWLAALERFHGEGLEELEQALRNLDPWKGMSAVLQDHDELEDQEPGQDPGREATGEDERQAAEAAPEEDEEQGPEFDTVYRRVWGGES